MSDELPRPDVDYLHDIHTLDQAEACLEDAGTLLRRIRERGLQHSDFDLEATLALVALTQRHLALLARMSKHLRAEP